VYDVEGETDILNVLGPYVAIEHRLSIDPGSAGSDDTVHAVIDMRSGLLADPNLVASDPAREGLDLEAIFDYAPFVRYAGEIVARLDAIAPESS
jgi:hypothetical protein